MTQEDVFLARPRSFVDQIYKRCIVLRIIIDTPSYVRVEGDSIVYFAEGKIRRAKLTNVKEIRIGPNVKISSNLILKAIKHGIFIVFVDQEEFAYIQSSKMYGTVKTQRMQIKIYDTERGAALCKAFAKASILTRAKLLNQIAKRREDETKEILKQKSIEIKEKEKEIDKINGHIDEIRMKIMNIEANAAETYFRTLSHIIPEPYGYKGKRTRKPPEDPFNAAISYAHSRVRQIVLQAIISAGLHPYFGYLHADVPGRISLVLDLAEEFLVPIAHATVIKLFTRRQIKEYDYTVKENAVYLNLNGRYKVNITIANMLKKQIKWRGINTTIEGTIYHQARHLANYIKGEEQTYKNANIPTE